MSKHASTSSPASNHGADKDSDPESGREDWLPSSYTWGEYRPQKSESERVRNRSTHLGYDSAWLEDQGERGRDDLSTNLRVKAAQDYAIGRYEVLESRFTNKLTKAANDLTEQLKDSEKKINENEKKAEDKLALLSAKLGDLAAQAKNDKLQAIQILAVFVALFTFVSVEFQLFSSLTDPLSVIALTLTLLGALLIFVCLILRGVHEANDGPAKGIWEALKRLATLVVACVLLAVGTGLFWVIKSNEAATIQRRAGHCREMEVKLIDPKTEQERAAYDRIKAVYDSSSCGESLKMDK